MGSLDILGFALILIIWGYRPRKGHRMHNSKPLLGVIVTIAGLLLLSSCNTGTADQPGGKAAEGRAEPQGSAGSTAVNPPGEAPGRYEIAADRNTATLPFEFYGMNLLIRGEINGKRVNLLIDNGRLWDQVWFYNGEADSLDLHYLRGAEVDTVVGAGEEGGSDILEGNPIDIDFGSIRFFDQPTLISPPEAGWGGFFPGVAGQVSSMLFKHFVVTFDFIESVITLTKPESFRPAGEGKAVPMQLEENGAYSIPVTIRMPDSEELEVRLDIDLGGIYPLDLIENEALNIRRPENSEKQHLGYGASGEITGYVGQIDMVRIGSYTLDNVTAVFVEEGANVNSDIIHAGTIGLPLMRRFNITFDYFNNLMYFEPNQSFGDSFE